MSKEFITVDLAKELGKQYRYSGVPWYLALVLKTYDETGKNVIEIVPRNLVSEMYSCLSHANRGTKSHLGHLGTIKMNNRTEFLFGIEATPAGTYIVKLNSNVDAPSFVRGFRAFPPSILKANAVDVNLEKTRSMVLAAFIYLQKHAKELAENGYLETNLRTILKIMYSKIPSDSKRLEQIANTLKRAIANVSSLTEEDGVIFVVEYYNDKDVNEFFDKSILTIKLVGDTLKNFLASFGMEPTIKKTETTEAKQKEPPLFALLHEEPKETQQGQLDFNGYERMESEELFSIVYDALAVLKSRHQSVKNSRKVAQT